MPKIEGTIHEISTNDGSKYIQLTLHCYTSYPPRENMTLGEVVTIDYAEKSKRAYGKQVQAVRVLKDERSKRLIVGKRIWHKSESNWGFENDDIQRQSITDRSDTYYRYKETL